MKKLASVFAAVALLSCSTSVVAQEYYYPQAAYSGQNSSVRENWIAAGIGVAAAVIVVLLAPEGGASHAH